MIRAALPLLAAVLLTGPAVLVAKPASILPPALETPLAFTCASPVDRFDTAATLKRRFGAQAVVRTVPGPEGTEFQALVLYPRDPKWRLEVLFDDEALAGRVSSVLLRGERSLWRVAGLRLGDGLRKVEAANGRAFQVGGFEWDYGGYVQDWKGGALSKRGCRIGMRMGLPGEGALIADGILGEVELQSNDSRVRAARPIVTELSISWPAAN
jgi:hypothetical protein